MKYNQKPVERVHTTTFRRPARTIFELARIIYRHRRNNAVVTFKVLRLRAKILVEYPLKVVLIELPLRPGFPIVNTSNHFPYNFPPLIIAYFQLENLQDRKTNFYLDHPHLNRFERIDLTTINPEYSSYSSSSSTSDLTPSSESDSSSSSSESEA